MLYFNCRPDIICLLLLCDFTHSVTGRSAVCDCGVLAHFHLLFFIKLSSCSIIIL